MTVESDRGCPATWAPTEQAATLGMSECVIGMPHRGRLNASWTLGIGVIRSLEGYVETLQTQRRLERLHRVNLKYMHFDVAAFRSSCIQAS